MKRMHLAFQPSLVSLIVFGIAGALWLSGSVAAAEPPSDTKVAVAEAGGDGALFAAFVPGSAPPSLHELSFSGRLSAAGRRRASAHHERKARRRRSRSHCGKMQHLSSGS